MVDSVSKDVILLDSVSKDVILLIGPTVQSKVSFLYLLLLLPSLSF